VALNTVIRLVLVHEFSVGPVASWLARRH
jgi:hypothetical protein